MARLDERESEGQARDIREAPPAFYLVGEQVAHLRHVIYETSTSWESRDVERRGASQGTGKDKKTHRLGHSKGSGETHTPTSGPHAALAYGSSHFSPLGSSHVDVLWDINGNSKQ